WRRSEADAGDGRAALGSDSCVSRADLLTAARPTKPLTSAVLRLEVAQERRVLAEQSLDLCNADDHPVLDPGLGEIVLDVMKAAVTHWCHDRPSHASVNGPGGSFPAVGRPTLHGISPDPGPRGGICSAVSPKHVPASQAELSRIGLLAELPGEQLV